MKTKRMKNPNRDSEYEYFKHLCAMVKEPSSAEWMEHIHSLYFEPVIAMDINRAQDGISLRNNWDKADQFFMLEKPCTILELLISLSQRLNYFVTMYPLEEAGIPYWFMHLVRNLGLKTRPFDKEYNTMIIDRLNSRLYNSDGTNGGLFPLKNGANDGIDQRNVEIWFQMQKYVRTYYRH